MDPNEIPAASSCPSGSMAGSKIGAQWGIDMSPRRATRRCDCRYDCGIFDQNQDQEPFRLFQEAHECHKCTLFSEQCKTLPAEGASKMEQGSNLKSQELVRNGLASPKARSPVQKLTFEPGIITKRPSGSADQSVPKLFVSALDASTLEEATNNFSFQEDLQAPFPEQHDTKASDQDSAYYEWQQKLEAAEALLILRDSFQAPAGSVILLEPCEPCVAPAPAGDGERQPPSPSLQPMLDIPISLPAGHPGCTSPLS
ncbi:PREDICTED: doublesex- and mab-3-related transcription factor C2 [Condylura cristata]|uniref:doublesex- and mab-3-related transcription factor C2 n=1 Tax=Condylura cristata TaxID=143302 RepID=UPI000642EA40|nr:PREDICTED: doublesex- and mab-3-related transcription factor C2 [Condylura cristata]